VRASRKTHVVQSRPPGQWTASYLAETEIDALRELDAIHRTTIHEPAIVQPTEVEPKGACSVPPVSRPVVPTAHFERAEHSGNGSRHEPRKAPLRLKHHPRRWGRLGNGRPRRGGGLSGRMGRSRYTDRRRSGRLQTALGRPGLAQAVAYAFKVNASRRARVLPRRERATAGPTSSTC
jgi:hypothetical protein